MRKNLIRGRIQNKDLRKVEYDRRKAWINKKMNRKKN